MNENSVSRLWGMRAAFVAISVLIVFLHLVPLQTRPSGWVAPDLILALGFGWALRRPEFVPALLFAAVMFFADLMLARPPGLFAALSLIGLEMLKARAAQLRDMPFTIEWGSAAIAIAAVIIGYRLVLALLLVEELHVQTAAAQIIFTFLCYPVVIFLSRVILRLRKPSLGDVNALGQRL